jgi:CBS domain-containing protein
MHLGEQFRGNVVTVEPDDTIVAAMWKMRDRNVGAVVVVEGKQVKGVVTDRDIAIRLCGGEAAPESSVSRIMSQPPITIREDQGVFNATQLMAEHQIRRLPVVNKKDELVGIVSFDDMLALCASELTNLSKVVEPTLIAQA